MVVKRAKLNFKKVFFWNTLVLIDNITINIITNVILMIMLQVLVDLNEDSWASDYFVIFFHSGANHPGLWQLQMNQI